MKTEITKIQLTTRITDHPPMVGARGIEFIPKEMVVTKYTSPSPSFGGVYAWLSGPRVLKSGEVGRSKHYLYITVTAPPHRAHELEELRTLQVTDPELAAFIEGQAATLGSLSFEEGDL